MKSALLSALSLLVSIASAFHIVPPETITACGPLTITYDTRTGTGPFSLSFHTGGSADGTVVAAFTNITGTSFTWNPVTISAGTSVVIVLADSEGLGSATPAITVSPGNSDVCLDNPTSIPTLPSVTSESPPTSSFNGSVISTSGSSSTNSGLSSSLSSVLSSTNSPVFSSTGTSSSTRSSSTGGLSTDGAMTNAADVFTLGVVTAFVGALLV